MMNQNGGLHKEVNSIFGSTPSISSSGVLLEEQPSKPISHSTQPDVESKMLPASLNNFKSSMSLVDRVTIWIEQQKAKGDTRQVVMVVLIPLLFVILAYILWGSIFPPSSAAPNQSSSAVKATANASSFTSSSQASTKYSQAAIYPENLRDPMAVASVSSTSSGTDVQTGGINVKGILFNATDIEKSSAIIGNKVLKVGDKIDDIEIIEITRTEVEFKNKDKVWRETVGQ